MAEHLGSVAQQGQEPRLRRPGFTLTLTLSLAGHLAVAAALWVERPPQPEAGAALSVEIVTASGAASSASANSTAGGRSAKELGKPETAPAPKAMATPDPPRAAHAPSPSARPPGEAARPEQPETAATPRAEIALRPPAPVPPATSPSPSAVPSKPIAPAALGERRIAEVVLRRPARIPPPPAKAPRLATAADVPPRGADRVVRPQTALVPIVAADAAPGAAAPGSGPESATTPPRYGFGSAANPIPRYPETARENGWEGVVMLSVNVGAGGEAQSVSIARSSGHSLLDAAAVDAVRRWRFEPARRAGVPVPGTATVPIRFKLED